MTASVLRVAQLNAGSLLEPDWPGRRLEIVAWLRRLDPDVVCLEEIWQDDNTAFRLEGDFSMDEAVKLGESLR